MNKPDKKQPERRPFFELWQLIAFAVVLSLGYLLANGGNWFPSTPRPREKLTGNEDRDGNFNLAADALFNQSEFGNSTPRVIHYLNQWAEFGGTRIDWKRHSLIEKLPRSLLAQETLKTIDQTNFLPDDIQHLQEAMLFRRCTTWIAERPVPEPYAAWLNELEKTIGADDKERLATTIKLFDWTVRNVRLDELLPPPPAPVLSAGDDVLSRPAALKGIPGPGYTHTPMQIIVQGEGDAWQRMRLFLLLARQAGVNGGVLAIKKGSSIDTAEPWLAGVLIAKKIYLFDANLGLPIPGAQDGSIATLEEVIADPQLLRNLDLPGLGKYPIEAEDLQKVVVFVDGTPQSISMRMQAVEQTLKGDRKLILTAPLTELRDGFGKSPGIKQVALWLIPFEAQMYTQGLEAALATDEARREEMIRRYGMFTGRAPLARGRLQHLIGMFDSVDQKQGARSLYLSCRASEKELRALAVSETARLQAGLEQQLPKQEPQRSQAIERFTGMLRSAKEHATFFLGIAHYEEGSYELAQQWFRDRIIEGAPDSAWVPAARYNLGRCYEALGEWNKARDQYVLDQSPQRYGNVLRATLIKKRQDAKKGTEVKEPERPAETPAPATQPK